MGQLARDDQSLTDHRIDHWPRHVFVRDNGPVDHHKFTGRDGVLILKPLS